MKWYFGFGVLLIEVGKLLLR